MMRAAAIAAVMALGPVLVVPVAGGNPSASRVIDRTFSCTVRKWAGDWVVHPTATSGFRDPTQRTQWKWLASAKVGGRDLSSYVSILAGSPPPAPEPGLPTRPWHWLYVDATHCSPAPTNTPHSSQGLTGGPASQLQDADAYDCRAASRISIRVTASFAAPVELRRRSPYKQAAYVTNAGVPSRKGVLTVRTASGRLLAHATVSESGNAQLFAAKGCTPE